VRRIARAQPLRKGPARADHRSWGSSRVCGASVYELLPESERAVDAGVWLGSGGASEPHPNPDHAVGGECRSSGPVGGRGLRVERFFRRNQRAGGKRLYRRGDLGRR